MADDKGNGGKRKGIVPESVWAEIRDASSRGESDSALSKRFGVHRNSIRNRREADAKRGNAWIVQPDVHLHTAEAAKVVQAQAQSKVIDIATRRAVEQAEADGTLDALQSQIAEELLATQNAAKLAGEYMVDLLTRAKNGEIEPASSPGEQTDADVAKAVMSAYRTFQTTVRENHGLRPGTPSIPDEKGTKRPTKIRFVIARPPATGTEG